MTESNQALCVGTAALVLQKSAILHFVSVILIAAWYSQAHILVASRCLDTRRGSDAKKLTLPCQHARLRAYSACVVVIFELCVRAPWASRCATAVNATVSLHLGLI